MADFEQAIEKTLEWEGGWSDDPNDSGGMTKYGISKNAHPDIDVESLSRDDAKAIYRADYWYRINGDDILDQQNAEAIFDFAVHSGVSRSIKVAQGIVGAATDGIVGPRTLQKLNLTKNFPLLFCVERIRYYTQLAHSRPKDLQFLVGWIRRALSFI